MLDGLLLDRTTEYKKMTEDYYKILGLDKKCSEDDIKKAYRKNAILYHPDKNQDKNEKDKRNAELKFKKINEAYEILSDPKKRKQYDMMGHSGIHTDINGYNFHNPNDIFKKFFGNNDPFSIFELNPDISGFSFTTTRNKKSKQIKKNPPKYILLDVPIKILYMGGTIEYSLTRKIMTNSYNIVNRIEKLMIDIKPGWKNGTKITFNDKGDMLDDNYPGDVIFIINGKDTDNYTRAGNDLVVTTYINSNKAANKITLDVQLIDNKILQVLLPEGIKGKIYTHSVVGEGMPIRKNGKIIGKGDLLIKIIVN